MKMLKLTAIASIIAITAGTSAVAGDTNVSAAGKSGSSRLLSYTLGEINSTEAQRASEILAYRMGYGESTPGKMTQYRYDFAPVLRYDSNINDGSVNDTVTISGYDFKIDESRVARSGILAGISFAGNMDVTIAQNTALQVKGSAYKAFAVGESFTKGFASVEACLSYRLSSSQYVDACSNASIIEGATSTAQKTSLEASFMQMTSFADGTQEFKVTVGSLERTRGGVDYDQGYIAASAIAAMSDGSVWKLGGRISEAVEGEQVTTRALNVSHTRDILGRSTTLGLGYTASEGGLFLGEDRYEETVSASLSRQINKTVSVGISYTKTLSDHDFFESDAVGGSVSIKF